MPHIHHINATLLTLMHVEVHSHEDTNQCCREQWTKVQLEVFDW